MQTDLTFFTNDPGSTLLDRFRKTLKDVRYFDILVGYFRTSGFHQLYQSLETVEKIRILVGLNVDYLEKEYPLQPPQLRANGPESQSLRERSDTF